MASELRYPEYRIHDQARIAVSDAAMALIASIRIAQDAILQRDQHELLPDAFPGVADLQRLNRRLPDAAELVERSERELVYMAIPYVLSVHHTYGTHCINLVSGVTTPETEDVHGPEGQPGLENLHTRLESLTGVAFPQDLLALFGLIRHVRNRLAHFAGAQGSHLATKWHALEPAAKEGWTVAAGRSLPIGQSSQPLDLALGELIAVLMVITRLAREMNAAVASAVPRTQWATILVADYRDSNPDRFGQADRRLSRCVGYARENYRSLGLSEAEIAAAIAATT